MVAPVPQLLQQAALQLVVVCCSGPHQKSDLKMVKNIEVTDFNSTSYVPPSNMELMLIIALCFVSFLNGARDGISCSICYFPAKEPDTSVRDYIQQHVWEPLSASFQVLNIHFQRQLKRWEWEIRSL